MRTVDWPMDGPVGTQPLIRKTSVEPTLHHLVPSTFSTPNPETDAPIRPSIQFIRSWSCFDAKERDWTKQAQNYSRNEHTVVLLSMKF